MWLLATILQCAPPPKKTQTQHTFTTSKSALKVTICFYLEAAINKDFSQRAIYFIQLQRLLNKVCLALGLTTYFTWSH